MNIASSSSSSPSALVPLFLGELDGIEQQLCNARDLHRFLEVRRDFSTWAKDRIAEYGFIEGSDYKIGPPNWVNQKSRGGDRRSKDYHLALDTAKEFAMVERTDRGRQARRYFIECERQLIASRQAAPQLPAPYTRNPTDVLTDGQAGLLRNMLAEAVKQLPPEMQGPAMVQGWSKLKSHFRVSYRKIPQAELTEAVSILARHIAEMLAKTLPALPPPRDDEARYFEIVGRMAAEKTTITLPMLVATTKVMAKIEGPDSASARFVQTHERLTQAKK